MDVSIVIVNYNTKDLILNCINSVYEKTKDVDYEIIVVDNNSSDDSVPEIKNRFQNVRVIKNAENIGFGRANNEGFKVAQGKYLFCLNPDTLLINNSIKILYDFMEANANCGACGGNLYDANMKPTFSFGYGDDIQSLLYRKTLYRWLHRREFKLIKNYEKNADKTKLQEVNHITGADLMLRKSVLDEVGFFNEKFFLYFEETELEVRIKRAGYKIFFVPDSKIMQLEDKFRNNKHNQFFDKSFVEYYRICYGEAWGEIAEFLTKRRIRKNEKL